MFKLNVTLEFDMIPYFFIIKSNYRAHDSYGFLNFSYFQLSFKFYSEGECSWATFLRIRKKKHSLPSVTT